VSVGYPQQARMLAAVADALGLECFDLVGNDSGGSIAQLLAVSAPERIRTLTLTNCEVAENNPPAALMPVVELARAGRMPALLGALLHDVASARLALAATFARPELAITAERLAYDIAPLVSSEDRKRRVNEYLTELSADVTLGIVPALERFTRPVLVLWGDADTYMSVDSARWLEAHVPGVERVVIVPGAKLFFPEEEPELVNRELRAFWRVAR
jgi:pimeloyl-ACP methyl ester carboxylesterase